MKYQKITNILDNTPNQQSKFRTKNWVEINNKSLGIFSTNSRIKTMLLKSSLCDYSDAYILVKGTMTVPNMAAAAAAANNANEKVIFKNCAPFTDCKSETNNVQVDNAKDVDVPIPIYNLTDCSDNYGNTILMSHI